MEALDIKPRARDIRVGSVLYPQNYAGIRKVIALDAGRAYWQGYDRHTGELFTFGACTIQHLVAWAARYATDAEIAMLAAEQV